MNEFLRSIKKDPSQVDFQAMINILITHAQSPEELVQVVAPYSSTLSADVLVPFHHNRKIRKIHMAVGKFDQ